MSHGYAKIEGVIHHGAHRIKTHKRFVGHPLRGGELILMWEVEWQRDWQTLHHYADHVSPHSWESIQHSFRSEDEAVAYAKNRLDFDHVKDQGDEHDFDCLVSD